MIGDMLRHFQLATVLKIRGDVGSAESMIADLRLDAGGFRAPLDHAVGVLLVHGFFREAFADIEDRAIWRGFSGCHFGKLFNISVAGGKQSSDDSAAFGRELIAGSRLHL
jgi:hypothetical protein